MKTSWLLSSLEIYFIHSVYWWNYIYSMTNNVLKDLFLLFQTLFVVWSLTFKGWIIDGWWIQLKINNNKIKSVDAGVSINSHFLFIIEICKYLVLFVTVFFPWFWVALAVPCHIRALGSQTPNNTTTQCSTSTNDDHKWNQLKLYEIIY